MTDKITDRTYVTGDQLRAAYDALALNPDQFKHTRSIQLLPFEVLVVRYVVDEQGHKRVNEAGTDVETVTTVLDVRWSEPPAVLGNGEQA